MSTVTPFQHKALWEHISETFTETFTKSNIEHKYDTSTWLKSVQCPLQHSASAQIGNAAEAKQDEQ